MNEWWGKNGVPLPPKKRTPMSRQVMRRKRMTTPLAKLPTTAVRTPGGTKAVSPKPPKPPTKPKGPK
jgi:hypothetical protein